MNEFRKADPAELAFIAQQTTAIGIIIHQGRISWPIKAVTRMSKKRNILNLLFF